jgi:hypothetical protein
VGQKLWHVSATPSPSSSRLIKSNFSATIIVFRQFFTWIALDFVDSRFLLILATKANAVEGETTSAA